MLDTHHSHRPAVLFLSHGGGPLPLLADPGHAELVANLNALSEKIKKPATIIVISAHWEETKINITHAEYPDLIYDYSGFPAESYDITYPAAGNPPLANALFSILNANGITTELNDNRGFDHGMFVPLKIMYPDADIPCIQVSLLKNLDPFAHIKLGEALAELSDKDVLIIGSGFSFHNMRAFFTPQTPESRQMNDVFAAWLTETCASTALDENIRKERLINWEQAPFARYCHPREEHLLPLHVCYGAAGRAAAEVFEFNILGIKASAYLW